MIDTRTWQANTDGRIRAL